MLQSMGWLRVRHDLATEQQHEFSDACTPVFTAALFTIPRTREQPRCPSADEWIRQLWYSYTMGGCRLWGHTELDTTEVT